MAKVVMPLLSAEASGKIANTMVFFYWKGRNVVRRWVVPTNPRSIDQMKIRTRLAAMGKNLAAMVTTASAYSKIVTLIRAVTPANMIWNAHFVQQTVDYVKTDAHMCELLTSFTNSPESLSWESHAITELCMEALTDVLRYDEEISPGFQLFMGAYAAFKLGLCSSLTNYCDLPSDWVEEKITSFCCDYLIP